MTGLIDFSTDASVNGLGAPPINFAERAPANSLNNSARAFMAALACWRDDNSGALLAGGTANALTLATTQTVKAATLKSGLTLAFQVSAANTDAVTLNPDGLGAKPLRRAGNLELAPGDLRNTVVYRSVYSDSASAHIIVAPTFEPPGKMAAFASVAAIPPGWRRCDGSLISRTAFKALFSAIGTAYGAGDGTTTFALPDLDGRVPFGEDNAKGRLTAAGGLSGVIGTGGGASTSALTIAQMPRHTPGGSVAAGGGRAASTTGADGSHDHGGLTGNGGAHTPDGTIGAAGAHRPAGSADAGGLHGHPVKYATISRVVTSNSDGSATAVSAIGAGAQTGYTENDGTHPHTLSMNNVPNHGHELNMAAVPNHQHGVSAAPNHQHTIPAVPDHNHGLTMAEIGGDQPHANMPPGLIAVWAIKA